MALQKQLVDIALQGLDTKMDAKLVAPGKMLTLENARFEKGGRISKKYGSSLLADTSALSTLVRRIHPFENTPLLVTTDGSLANVATYSPSLGAAVSAGALGAPSAYIEKILGGIGTIAAASARVSSTIIAVAVRGTAGAIVVVWFDTSTNQVAGTFNTGLVGDDVKIVAANGVTLLLVYASATTSVEIYEADPLTSITTLRATLTTQAAGLGLADVAVDNAGTYLFYANHDTGAANRIRLWRVTLSGWATTSAFWDPAVLPLSIGICAYADVRVFWNENTNGVSTRTYSNALANTLATTIVVAGVTPRKGLAAKMNSAGVAYLVWQEAPVAASGVAYYSIEFRQVSTLGVASSSVTTRSMGLASKPFLIVDSGVTRVFVLGSYAAFGGVTATQQAVMLIQANLASQSAKARLLYNLAGPPLVRPGVALGTETLPDLHQFSSATTGFACACLSRPSSDQQYTTNLAVFDYAATGKYDAVEVGGSMLIGGGILHSFDGTEVRENGFLLFPEIAAGVDGAAGALADGVYSVIVLYERTDALGRVVRSAISNPLSVTVSGRAGVGKLTLSVMNYTVGISPYSVGDTSIVAYVATPGSTTYYRSGSVANITTTGESTLTVTAVSTSSAIIYTQGGEEENTQPDAPLALAADKDRVWIVSGTDRYSVAPSKPIVEGFGVSFYPELVKNIASAGGPVTALARMDGKTFALKERDVFYSPGEGPDVGGNSDTMGEFERLHLSAGATNQNSVVRTEDGIMVRGNDGIHTIKRDLSIEYTGAPVDSYNATALRGCAFNADTSQVHFALESGAELIYNTEFAQWSSNPKTNAIAIAVIDGNRHFAADSAFGDSTVAGLYKTSPTSFNEAHTAAVPRLLLVTGWIKLASIQGLMRAYELLILGESLTAHTLQVRIAYDYEASFTQTATITSVNATTGSSAYQFRVPLARQKCESFQIEIQDQSLTGTGESYNLSGIAVVAGIKPGAYKLSAIKTVV